MKSTVPRFITVFAGSWLACSTLAVSAVAQEASDAESPARQAAIDAARESLQRTGGFWGHPWYDSTTDKVDAIAVQPRQDWSWLEDFIDDWFGWLGDLNLGDVFALLGWILLAIVLAVVAYLIIRAYLDREAKSGGTAAVDASAARLATIERVQALPAPVRDPHADFLAEARRHYREGNFGEAIVYLFSYQLIELDKHDLLRLSKGKTNRQYVREVNRNQPTATDRPLAGLLQQTMLLFEESFFGGRPPGRLALDDCWSALEDFQSQLAFQPMAEAR